MILYPSKVLFYLTKLSKSIFKKYYDSELQVTNEGLTN